MEADLEAGNFPGLIRVHIDGYRSIRDASFRPGRLSALVGESSAGKSNVLEAIRAVLDPTAPPLVPGDIARDGDGTIRVSAEFAHGSSSFIAGLPQHRGESSDSISHTPLFLPADLRSSTLVALSANDSPPHNRAVDILQEALAGRGIDGPPDHPHQGATAAAHGLVDGLEACLKANVTGMILLIEEPELFLPPQIQRYLYRLLHQLSEADNQIFYSTHSPSFLNVARLDELVLIELRPGEGTRLFQPEPLPANQEFVAASEFDASRGELFLARAAVLVEGLTEKLALPFVFRAMGHDADRERISIVECGGKSNIVLAARIAKAVGVPFVALHDRDAPAGKKPNEGERHLNMLIGEIAGEDGRVEMVPDFEGISGLRGHRNKPERAWERFSKLTADEIPAPLAHTVERAVKLASRSS